MGERCYAVVGTAMDGPQFCGNPAKSEDVNGRPVCDVPTHKKGQPDIRWGDNDHRYPEGTGGRWRFRHGEKRR